MKARFRHIATSLLAAAILLVGQPMTAQTFRASTDRSEVPLDGRCKLTYTFENVEMEEFTPPDFKSFQAYGPSQSRNMSWVNGKVTQTLTYTYTLQPTAEGEFEIPPARARIDGRTASSNPVNIKVLPAGSDGGRNDQQSRDQRLVDQINENLFVRVIPGKSSIYAGEQVTLTYKLYYNLTLDDLSIRNMPAFDGFLSYDIDLPDKRPQQIEQYRGRQFNTQVIHQTAVFPGRAGTFDIPPMELQALVLYRANDPGFFFPRTERKRHDFKSNTLRLEVLPLPTKGRPLSFTGAVGEYQFSAAYDRTSTYVDDPVTLKVSISGKGNIKLIDLPEVSFPQSLEVYDPKVNESSSGRSGMIRGSKTFEYLIIPRGGGTFELPDISFSYFDPARKEYITHTEEGPSLEVEGSSTDANGFSGQVFNKEEIAMLGEDIRFIKTEAPSFETTVPLLRQPVFHVFAWMPALLFMILPFINNRLLSRRQDVTGERRRKALRMATRRLRAASRMEEINERAFYDEVSKALWGYLCDRFSIPPSDHNREVMQRCLDDHQVPMEMQEQFSRLMDDCEMAVYAPDAVAENRQEVLDHAIRLIDQLDKMLSS